MRIYLLKHCLAFTTSFLACIWHQTPMSLAVPQSAAHSSYIGYTVAIYLA